MTPFSSDVLRSQRCLTGARRDRRCSSHSHPLVLVGRTDVAPLGQGNSEPDPERGFVVPATVCLCSSDASGSGWVTAEALPGFSVCPQSARTPGGLRLTAPVVRKSTPESWTTQARCRHPVFLRATRTATDAPLVTPTGRPRGEGAGGPLEPATTRPPLAPLSLVTPPNEVASRPSSRAHPLPPR